MSVRGSAHGPSASCNRGNSAAVSPNSSLMMRCALRAASSPLPMTKTASIASGIWSWMESVSMMTSLYPPLLVRS